MTTVPLGNVTVGVVVIMTVWKTLLQHSSWRIGCIFVIGIAVSQGGIAG